jgi:hypothetical protein
MYPYELTVFCVGIYQERFVIDNVQVPFRGARILREPEYVRIFTDQVFLYPVFAIYFRSPPVDVVERTDVVEPSGVVLVVVGQEDGVKMAEIVPKHLHPEIRPCVDQYLQAPVFHIRRCPQAFVPWIL